MTDNIYDPGNTVELTVEFTRQSGAYYDPTTVQLKYLAPGSSVIATLVYGFDAAVTKETTGIYHCLLDATLEGSYRYRWVDPDGKAAGERSFQVRRSPFV